MAEWRMVSSDESKTNVRIDKIVTGPKGSWHQEHLLDWQARGGRRKFLQEIPDKIDHVLQLY